MEAETNSPVSDQTNPTGTNGEDDAWVSPEVAAAMAGERVEMGKDLPNEDDQTEE